MFEPAFDDAVFGKHKVLIAFRTLLDGRKRLDPPPTVITIARTVEGIPIIIGRLRRLIRAETRIIGITVKIAAVVARMIENAVQNNAHPLLFGIPNESIEVFFARFVPRRFHLVVLASLMGELVEVFVGLQFQLAQTAFVIVEEFFNDIVVKRKGRKQVFADTLIQDFANLREVVTNSLFGFEFSFLFLKAHIALDDQEEGQQSQQEGNKAAANENNETNNRGQGARRQSCQEPTADHRKNAGNTINGSFAVPGTVSKGRTHGDHEGHVGC